MGFSLLLMVVLTGTNAQASEEPRMWTNLKGNSVTGILVEKGDGWVKVEIKSKVHKIELDTLSKEDQEYVKKAKISKKFALRVTTESHKPDDIEVDERKVHVELEGVDGRKLYCLVVWIARFQSGQGTRNEGTRIKYVVEDFCDKDGKYSHEASFSLDQKDGQVYKGYAVRILDKEGNTLAETADPSSNLTFLDKARTSYKPEPKDTQDED